MLRFFCFICCCCCNTDRIKSPGFPKGAAISALPLPPSVTSLFAHKLITTVNYVLKLVAVVGLWCLLPYLHVKVAVYVETSKSDWGGSCWAGLQADLNYMNTFLYILLYVGVNIFIWSRETVILEISLLALQEQAWSKSLVSNCGWEHTVLYSLFPPHKSQHLLPSSISFNERFRFGSFPLSATE